MKTVNKIKEKKRKSLKKPKPKDKKEKVLIVAQEIKFARLLSGNEKKTRDRVLKTFKKWLLNCFAKGYEFKEDDFIRVWKGLFYAVWMSDKPLVQEELCETIASILDLFPPEQIKHALLMTKAGFKVLATEWYGIDQHRMDKFLMLVRRYLRGSLRIIRRAGWGAACKQYADMLTGSDGLLCPRTPLYARNAGSMLMHFVDCFLEELSKVSEGEVPGASVTELLRPFCGYMCAGDSPALCVACRRLLTELLRQTEQGLAYRDKTRAWKQMGCPRGGPDALQLDSDDEAEEEEIEDDDDDDDVPTALDPRAGRVDVILHPVSVDASGIARTLKGLLATAGSKAHKRTKICLQRFEQLAKDEYPLKVEDVYGSDDEEKKPKAAHAAKELKALEKKLVAASDELALRGLSRKHRKRVLAKSRSGVALVSDTTPAAPLMSDTDRDVTSTNGDWAVQATEKKAKKHKLNTSNKENVHKDRNAKKPKHTDTRKESKKEKQQKHASKQKLEITPLKNGIKHGNKEKMESIPVKSETKHENKRKTEAVPVKNEKHASKQKIEVTPVKTETKNEKNHKNDKQFKLPRKTSDVSKKTLEVSTNKQLKLSKKTNEVTQKKSFETPKKVKFVLKNNSMQGTIDYYKSVRQSPNIPYDGSKKPTKTNLKPSTPSPLNPFAKKKLRLK
ncbi:ribosomal RNA processing protein 1 homolog [Ostrinia furnacalis]|uniref:ribosomal RNA processing protein 1 homolog n=1 Tax=Ostrinia furnacalis TaxID=93504 RepID=UPI001038D9D9|nr:ribosomal RNA processing protein 1 homolog [Ostrinia furnacalis]